MTHHINTDHTAVVSDFYTWQPINTCPRKLKVLLLTDGGSCVVGPYDGQSWFTHWAPLPRRSVINNLVVEHIARMKILDELKED
jgi:hypothetical protein